mmetsp:Transcript_3670/g.6566  ORF Transcript_3670/g.6566 Transcript_3670/m.6566 type:complete len:145 (-) Transcript_3670:36-470(-)
MGITCRFLVMLLAPAMGVRTAMKSEANATRTWPFENPCATAKCNDAQHMTWAGAMARFKKCTPVHGKFTKDGVDIKPEQIQPFIDYGDYVCVEKCMVYLEQDDGSLTRKPHWKTPWDVYRAGDVENPKCVFGMITIKNDDDKGA